MNKPMKKAFSVGLVVCLLLSVLPASATAEAIEADGSLTSSMLENQITVNDTISETSVSDDMTVIREETSLRGAYEKHFLMSDGSYQAVLYNEPVHKLTDGQWVEIDNTLTLQSGRYATADGLTDVSFSSSFGDDLVTMEQGSYTLSWGVQAVSNSLTATATAQAQLVTTDLSGFTAEEQMTMAVKSSSSIHYPNALRQNVDLEYIVLPSRVKENIILQSAQDISFYMVTVYAENLSARLLENRQIEFYNENDEVIFTMASPYMYDSAGELSEDITVELAEKSGGVYFIKMTPDAGWLADESRVYPVVIDPEVSTDTTQQNIIDNYVLEGAGVQNYNLDRLYIGNKSGSTAQAYIQFAAMPTIPTGSTITSATMTTTIVSGTSTAYNASAYMVTGDEWASSTIQWSNKPAAETQLEANISHNNKTKYQFSCLTAVQHWYDGDPTGQNQNYGVMIRYYDETIADYNSFYSADHTDETLRPVLAISYQPQLDEIDIPEGLTYPLSISGATGTVTWTSSNPGAATVDANGNVTGIKAGCTMITAYVDGLEQKSYVVYVTLQEGVYYIRQGESLCIGTNGCVAENTAVTMQGISGTTEFNQLWRIKYLSNGYYSIRPMYKLNMALHCTDSAVDIVSTGTTDSLENVTYWSRWTITYDSSGYLIQCWGRADKTMYSSNPYPSASVAVGEYASSNSSFKWDFERVTSITNQVLLLNDPSGTSAVNAVRYAAPGETLTLDDLGITASFVCSFDIDQSITWGTLNEDAVYVDPDTGAVTALVPDRTATITATHTLNGLNYQKQYTVRIVAVPSGVFFIRNPQSEKYVQIRFDTAANSYMTSGAYMEQRTCCGSDYQKWAITLLNDGYYSIISVQSGLALSVVSNQTASADVTLIQEAYSGADRQKWAISVTDAGYYKIKAKSSETANEDLTMAVDGSNVNSLDGIVIQQDTYVNDTTYLDEWQLCSMIDIGMSTDDYNTSPSDSHRACYRHATTFYDGLLNIAGGVPTTKTHHYNMDSTQTAFVDDFAQYGAISDEIDFMVYIGHGHAADSHTENGALGNHLHYNCGIIDDPHVYVDNTEMYTHCNPASNVYTDGMEFGSSTSDLRWVWLYTCHFLAENEYVSNDDLKGMMNGAHIVMGYATQSYLCDPNALKFGQYLRSGETIIRSFFKAGNEGEGIGKANGGTDDHHIQKVLFIPQAEYETIYSPQIKYEYDPSDVKIITNDIQVPYD